MGVVWNTECPLENLKVMVTDDRYFYKKSFCVQFVINKGCVHSLYIFVNVKS